MHVVVVISRIPSLFSRGHATLHLAGRSVGPSVRPSVTFLNSERFLRYCSCPTVRDWIAVYPALFNTNSGPNSSKFRQLMSGRASGYECGDGSSGCDRE